MANTKYILDQIKVAGELHDLCAKARAEDVTVDYNGKTKLSEALADILTSVGTIQTQEQVQTAIKAAIDDLINGAPETYDTLQEIAKYIEEDKTAAAAMTQQIAGKVSTEAFTAFQNSIETLGALAGKDKVAETDLDEGLAEKINTASQGQHTHTNKEELDKINSGDVAKWNAKADKTPASQDADGLMSSTDKKRLDDLRGVRYGESAPEDMQDGELFVKVVGEE